MGSHRGRGTADGVIACVGDGVPRTTAEVAASLDADPRATADRLERLAERGALGTKTVDGTRIWWSTGPGSRSAGSGASSTSGEAGEADSAFEREVAERLRQQETIADLGRRALGSNSIDGVIEDTPTLVVDALGADRCTIAELDADARTLTVRSGAGWDGGPPESEPTAAVDDVPIVADTLADAEPVVVEDVRTDVRFDGDGPLAAREVRSAIAAVVGSSDDPWGVLLVDDGAPESLSGRDAGFVRSVATVLSSAITRRETEQALAAEREQLTVLNNLYEAIGEINSSIIEQSTPDEIERVVCEHLAETDSYRFAWVGRIDSLSQSVTARTEAGVEGYLDDITISIDDADDRSDGPTGRAFRTGDVQTAHAIVSGTSHDAWPEHPERYDYRSSAAIPIVHEGTVYGVLNVYSERPYAFQGRERDVIARLGEIVGHAIAAAERKQALVSDELVELGFRIADAVEGVDAPGTIRVDHAVALDERRFVTYGTASEEAVATVRRLVDRLGPWEGVRFYGDDDPASFELRLDDPPVLTRVSSFGGSVEEAVLEDGTLRLTAQFASTVDVRAVVDALEEVAPDVEMLHRRQLTRTYDDPRRRFVADLTDKQRSTLEAAYYAGFFEWPRDASGEDVAASMDVSAPTFHQHLRKAERKVFDALFSTPDGDGDR